MQAIYPTDASIEQVPPFISSGIDIQVIHLVQPDTLSDKDILTGEAYRLYVRDLSTFLLEDIAETYPNRAITLSPMKLEHFYIEGHLDRIICRLLQREEDATCFDIMTSFFCGTMLVTTAEQSAFLNL